MSKKPSSTPPTVSPGAASDGLTYDDICVIEASHMLATFGAFGLLCLDRELNVVHRVGPLVADVAIGKPVTESLLPLVGLEDEILALETSETPALLLPVAGVATSDNKNNKLNFTFFWNTARDCPMAWIHRSTSQTGVETELSKQIRARLMAEAEVSAKSKELARANADLESFAAIVSHDLQAPLRHMRHLVTSAHADIDAGNDAAARNRLDAIEIQSRRITGMLSALLDYSALGRKYEAIEPVDTRALVEEIKKSLPRSGHTIDIAGNWPTLTTLRAPLDLIMRNLLANALQHHDRTHGNITISCEDHGTALNISVADDGPGIDPRHHLAIFQPFRTLQSDATDSSTGMGLAAVRKTVTTVHGRISVHSDPERQRGTTFTVTWPKALPD